MIVRTLYILRHATSPWPAGVKDFERPLSADGAREAQAIADKISSSYEAPEFVLCSPARRTRDTCEPFQEQWPNMHTEFPNTFFNAEADSLYEAVKGVDTQYKTGLVIAHNPGIHILANSLVGSGDDNLRMQLAVSYRPATLSVLRCDCDSWEELELGANKLEALLVAREL